MKNTGLIIALGVVSGIAVAATAALCTQTGRDTAEKATGKVKEVSGKAVVKTKEVTGKVAGKVVDTTKKVSDKVISKIKKAPAVEATCEEIFEEAAEVVIVEAVDEEEELPEIAPEEV